MARYPNGWIPFEVLVHLGGEHYLTPSTASKWRSLQADVLKNEGVLLEISRGANGYRWYEKQVEAYRDSPPGDAAYPGTSSHGGEYNGVDAMAIDVGNWGLIGMAKFYTYARKHGFEPGYFSWEPWHIIDWDPWAAVPSEGGGHAPEIIPIRKKKKNMQVIRTEDGGGFRYALVGEFTFQAGQLDDTTQPNLWAQTWGDFKPVSTDGWYEAINMVNVARNALGLPPVV